MIKQNIVNPNFSGEIGRLDYVGVQLSVMGIYIVGAIVFGAAFGALDAYADAAFHKPASIMIGLLAVAGVLWTTIIALSALVKRFRNMGMTSPSTLTIATIAITVANAFIPLVSLIPIFWRPANKEAV